MASQDLLTLRIADGILAALEGGGADQVSEFVDHASLLHVAGRTGLAGEYQGRDAILGLGRHMAELTARTLRFGVPVIVRTEAGVTRLRTRATATRKGRRLDSDLELVVAVHRQRVREIWVDHPDQSSVDEFWS